MNPVSSHFPGQVPPVRLLLLYAPADASYAGPLRTQLLSLRPLVVVWHEGAILPGADREREMLDQIDQADIVLLLLSPDFLASGLDDATLYQRARTRAAQDELRIVPVLTRPLLLEAQPELGALKSLPENGRPISSWKRRDEALHNVASSLLELVKDLDTRRQRLWKDNVVLTMHPGTFDVWRDAIPGLSGLELRQFVIDTPDGRWHQADPPVPAFWNAATASIQECLDALSAAPWRSLHLFADGPYGLGALLGSALFQRFGRSRSLIPYQFDHPSQRRVDWGPEGRPPAPHPPALLRSLEPAEPVSAGARDVVLAFSLTQRLSELEITPALENCGCRPASTRWLRFCIERTSQDAIGRTNVDPLVGEIETLLFSAIAQYPQAAFHVFYSGPLALWIRAAAKLHNVARPVTLYERIGSGTTFRFIPVVRFEAGRSRLLEVEPGVTPRTVA